MSDPIPAGSPDASVQHGDGGGLDPAQINSLVNEAIKGYAAIEGLDPKSWDHRKVIDMLNNSRDWDPGGVTTFMLVRGLVDNYLDANSFSARTVIHDTEIFLAQIKKIKDLLTVVEHPDALEVVDGFKRKARLMARAMGCTNEEDLDAFLENKWSIACIRMASLRSMEKLRPFQFIQGEPDDDRNLKVNPTIYEFWNINSLVQTLSTQAIPGVTMCLIRDPEEIMASYFVFALRNGENLTILTDKAKVPHPNFWKMSKGRRGIERDFQEKMNQHWFPYAILGLQEMVGENGEHVAYVRPTVKSVVTYQSSAIRRGSLGEFSPEEMVWAGFVMERIRDEYGQQAKKLPELAYTTEMIVRPNVLVQADSRLMTAGLYQPLGLEPLAPEAVTKKVMEKQIKRGHSYNQWLEDRYLSQVPSGVLNILGQAQLQELHDQTMEVFTTKEERTQMEWRHDKPSWFASLSPVDFGTKEEVERDRVYIARANAVAYMRRLAKAEFQAEGKTVMDWYVKGVTRNLPNLIKGLAHEQIKLPVADICRFGGGTYRTMWCVGTDGRLYETVPSEGFRGMGNAVFGGYTSGARKPMCFLHPELPASYLFAIDPRCAEAVAEVAGVGVEELPLFLRYWLPEAPYVGNSILERLDPLDDDRVNPWMKGFQPRVCVYLSKTAWRELRKKHGLPHVSPTLSNR